MKAYRKRFVELSMLQIGIVLSVVIVLIFAYTVNNYYHDLHTTMEQILMPLQHFERFDTKDKLANKDDDRDNFVTIFYSLKDEEYSVLSFDYSYSDEEIKNIIEEIIKQDEDFGTLKGYHLIYYKTGSDLIKIAFVLDDYLNTRIIRLTVVLLLIWTVAMLTFLLISIKFSKYASKPMEEAIDREKQFVTDASHDLKTPLSIILANNAIVLENPDACVKDVKHWLDSNVSSAKRMQELINQMLTLASVETKDTHLKYERIDFSSLVTKIALESDALAYEKLINFDIDIAENCYLVSDADYLNKIVISLLENAFKYEPENGKVSLKLENNKHIIKLSIRNYNSFINKEDVKHVFERFYRSDKSRQNEGKSFGLGLSITKEMVEKLNGEISLISNLEIGTCFIVKFHI